jgi:hypothetical protein
MPLCEEAVGRHMWEVAVLQMAFDHEYVCSALLGVSALHLLSMNPADVSLKYVAYH